MNVGQMLKPFKRAFRLFLRFNVDGDLSALGPFLERPGNLSGPIGVFGDKCFLAEVHFC